VPFLANFPPPLRGEGGGGGDFNVFTKTVFFICSNVKSNTFGTYENFIRIFYTLVSSGKIKKKHFSNYEVSLVDESETHLTRRVQKFRDATNAF
jgi:hypothetical protein